MGEYDIPCPNLQEDIDKWCDESSVSKEGYFYKNASSMCADMIPIQLKPWKDENKKLKLLIEVMESKMFQSLCVQALYNINTGNDTIPHIVEDDDGNQVKKGTLILSYQHEPEEGSNETH